MEFRVYSLGLRVEGLGCRDGLRVWGLWIKAYCLVWPHNSGVPMYIPHTHTIWIFKGPFLYVCFLLLWILQKLLDGSQSVLSFHKSHVVVEDKLKIGFKRYKRISHAKNT